MGERLEKFGAAAPPPDLLTPMPKKGGPIIKTGSNLQPFTGIKSGRDQLMDVLNTVAPGTEMAFEVKDKNGKTRTVTVTLDTLPGSLPGKEWKVPDKVPPGSIGKARDPRETAKKKDGPKDDTELKKVETGLKERSTGDGEHKYWVYVPKDYEPDYSYGVICYLHLAGKNKKVDAEDVVELWGDYCAEHRLVLVMPQSQSADGWIPSEGDFVVQSVRDVMKLITADPQRVVAHGMGVGGQMALYLGTNNRDLFRGVATVGAVPTTIKDNLPNQRLAFWLAGGELDPLVKSIAEARTKLAEKRFSAVFVELPNRGREYLSEAHLRDLARWIDTLDKQ